MTDPPSHHDLFFILRGASPRQRLRFWQLFCSALTVLATCWCCSHGVFQAILSLSIAKHVLVAILLTDLGVDAPAEHPDEE